MKVFDEVALCVMMLVMVYFWVGFLIISLLSFTNQT